MNSININIKKYEKQIRAEIRRSQRLRKQFGWFNEHLVLNAKGFEAGLLLGLKILRDLSKE